jgi:uncharacterized surface anchored protein
VGNEELTGKTVQWIAPEEEGTYDVTLKVSDGICPVKETAKITVSKLKLVINVDKNVVNIDEGETAQLSYSVSPEGYDVTNATWSLISKPEGSSANLVVSGTGASLTPDVEGVYQVQLTAYHDSMKLTALATVTATSSSKLKVVKGQAVDPLQLDEHGNPKPIAGALVELYDKYDRTSYDKQTVTDSNGFFTFTDVPPGDYYLVIKVNGYEIESQEVKITE